MPKTHDRDEIRRALSSDREWSVYALGDLEPGMFEDCEWYAARGPSPGLVLFYGAFDVPVLFAMGQASVVRELLQEAGPWERAYLSVRPDVLQLVKRTHEVEHETAMWRMILRRQDLPPDPDIVALGLADLPRIRELHADGEAMGEVPDFFTESMLERGVYVGILDGEELIASAGTHLVSARESVAAIGNVYVRRDRRGLGLGTRVTRAVAAELLGKGIETIALNVAQSNAPGIRAYTKVGFRGYCEFWEGVAVSRG